ncbi:MAG: hypothetical protein CSA70_04335 [Rhodobacterales bacterium]|nr:MAG: hypothetical protein CSA70_04335 [Rhodobacterales bacterium]
MNARVCPGDGNANNSDERIAIHPEDMAKAIELGIVPDEVVAAGKTHVTQDEMHLYSTLDETNFMSTGMTAWRAIAFALERDLALPVWVKQYLSHVASGIEDWAALNEHPSALKAILHLEGKRFQKDESRDPRWVYEAICQMREDDPKASVASLVREFLKKFPEAGDKPEERVRQKYYQGKRLAEKGEDYKGRGRKGDILGSPNIVTSELYEPPDF